MTADDFRHCLARVGLSQVGAARLFAVNDRTARRWAAGEQDIPAAVVLCLLMMQKYRVSPAAAERLAAGPGPAASVP